MIDTNHWGYQQILREAIQYRMLRRMLLEAVRRPAEDDNAITLNPHEFGWRGPANDFNTKDFNSMRHSSRLGRSIVTQIATAGTRQGQRQARRHRRTTQLTAPISTVCERPPRISKNDANNQ